MIGVLILLVAVAGFVFWIVSRQCGPPEPDGQHIPSERYSIA